MKISNLDQVVDRYHFNLEKPTQSMDKKILIEQSESGLKISVKENTGKVYQVEKWRIEGLPKNNQIPKGFFENSVAFAKSKSIRFHQPLKGGMFGGNDNSNSLFSSNTSSLSTPSYTSSLSTPSYTSSLSTPSNTSPLFDSPSYMAALSQPAYLAPGSVTNEYRGPKPPSWVDHVVGEGESQLAACQSYVPMDGSAPYRGDGNVGCYLM